MISKGGVVVVAIVNKAVRVEPWRAAAIGRFGPIRSV
jgi:hypothetical protein